MYLLYQFLMTKQSTPRLNFFKHLNKHINLLGYSLPFPAMRVPITSPQSGGTVGHFGTSFNRVQLIAQLMGECVLAPAYGSKGDIVNSDNVVIEWAIIEAVKQCSKFVESVNNSQTYHKLLASRIGRANALFKFLCFIW